MKWMWFGGALGGLLAIALVAVWFSELPGADVWSIAVGSGLTLVGMLLGGLWGTREREGTR